ncbi:hypothetical protein OC846_002255 [Tilletia horrida]|uniref:G-patch domain-containing protein n=1 Tax=Tilletia horrida TaxID=155126 RepID=A0AAN6JSA6_9BASI|nr:hypothetical protein OC845_004892 [Tilletia horrida]KAK0554034.1 hypothetical protein OC846_002255 [Tilletia horrida]KAK0561664.1 hypothetical protein OC861_005702 [Tilletia horrida]
MRPKGKGKGKRKGTPTGHIDDHSWHHLHTGPHPQGYNGPAHLLAASRSHLPPLPPIQFVRSTILSANWGDGNDGSQPVLHYPEPYIFPLRTPCRPLQHPHHQPKAPINNEHDPILISDDEDDNPHQREFEVTKVTRPVKRSDRPGIGAQLVKGKEKEEDAIVEVIEIDDNNDDDDTGRFNMAQTYAALIEAIGGSTQKADKTLKIEDESYEVIDDSDDGLEITQVVKAPGRPPSRPANAASPSRPRFTCLPERPRFTGLRPNLPARPEALVSSGLPPRQQFAGLRPSLPVSPAALVSTTAQAKLKARNRVKATVQPAETKSQKRNRTRKAAKLKLRNASDIARHSRYIGTVPCPQCQMLIPDRISRADLLAHRASMPHRLAVGRLGGRPDEILAETARQVERHRRDAERRRARTRALFSSLGVSADEDIQEGTLLLLTRRDNRGFALLERSGWEAGMGIGRKEWLRSRRIRKQAKEQERLQKEQDKAPAVEVEAGAGAHASTLVGTTTASNRIYEEIILVEKVQQTKEHESSRSPARTPAKSESLQNQDVDALANGILEATLEGTVAESRSAAGAALFQSASTSGDAATEAVPSSAGRQSTGQADSTPPPNRAAARKPRWEKRKEQAARLRAAGKTADSAIALSDSDGEDDPVRRGDDQSRMHIDGDDPGGFLDFRFDDSSDELSNTAKAADEEEEEGSDVEWVGVDTKRKRGEGVHAWLLRKNSVNQHARKVEASKKRKRSQEGEEDEDEWEDEQEDGEDEEDPDEVAARAAAAATAAAAAGSTVPIPAMNHMSRTQPLAVSIRMQHALDKSGIGASVAHQTPARLAASFAGPVDVLRIKQHRTEGGAMILRREGGEDSRMTGPTGRIAAKYPVFRRSQQARTR